jgi:hypothetical protein
MRITVNQKDHRSFLYFIVLLLVVSSLFLPVVSAQEEKSLYIELFDNYTSQRLEGNVFFEGKKYDIVIGAEGEVGFAYDVTVTALGATYITSEELPVVTIEAPRFDEYDSFVITASKGGYLPADIEITVLKGELIITIDRGTVEEKKEFQVTVRDLDTNPVEGAMVYTDPDAAPVLTDVRGIAYLDAPEVDKDTIITIQVLRSGYEPGSITLRVENVGGLALDFTGLTLLQMIPILFAIVAVIFAIVYVRWRKTRTPRGAPEMKTRPSEELEEFLEEEKIEKRDRKFEKEPALYPVKERRNVTISTPDPKVEEIRIPLQEKKKETTILSREQEKASSVPRKDDEEWFKGQEYMRYKLDELTGKIDQKTEGKWFEGERDGKYKVDETLKKSSKKKKVDEAEK